MLILLPPSETKRAGGSHRPLDVGGLALPALAPQREAAIDAMVALSADAEAARRVLKLGATQADEASVNTALRTGPTLPAVDRYTGVLFDALNAASLDGSARRWLAAHVLVHSAPFGPVGALDRIPAYRLGAAASVPGLPPLRRLWADAVSAALGESSSFVLDLRSEAYVALGPVPASVPTAYVRVVTEVEGGAVRALNHFNKHAKGAFVRALALARPRVSTLAGMLRWADDAGWTLRHARGSRSVDLVAK
ncbi:MAG TPA: peroxide stress protein YaaA [Microbacterium sp.]|uniref:YaaA family protein n=1 Tax=Microbacterium sp. TaxID=51671 RepID=UPI002CEDB3B1|nr:peroxide stress protein YaaA [Microbacterium sp.]HWI32641.1 peroxide stress protein YaaA [Microbacterium sp.]